MSAARSSAKPGYDTATVRQPRTVEAPATALAATAAAMATRWSPWLFNVAARGVPPRTTSRSGPASTPTPSWVQLLVERGEPVALLHPQLRDGTELGDPLGERGRDGEGGHLVDEALRDRDLGPVERRGLHGELPDRLAEPLLTDGDADVRPHAAQRVDEPEPGRVQPDVLDDELGAGRDGGGDDEERGGRDVAGHDELERGEPAALHPDGGGTVAGHGGAERGEEPLAVIAARGRLDDLGDPVGLEAGEQQRGLHLPARVRELVAAADERPAADGERRVLAVLAAVDVRAHGPQRRRDAWSWAGG